MLYFLDRLREKPPSYRRAVALTIVTVIVGLIFILWVVTLLPKISGSQIGIRQSNSSEEKSAPRPFSAITGQVKLLYESGTRAIINFMEFGGPIEYVQEERRPDNVKSFLYSEDSNKEED